MSTLTLAWINAKYRYNFELLFIGTFFIDLHLIDTLAHIFNTAAVFN